MLHLWTNGGDVKGCYRASLPYNHEGMRLRRRAGRGTVAPGFGLSAGQPHWLSPPQHLLQLWRQHLQRYRYLRGNPPLGLQVYLHQQRLPPREPHHQHHQLLLRPVRRSRRPGLQEPLPQPLPLLLLYRSCLARPARTHPPDAVERDTAGGGWITTKRTKTGQPSTIRLLPPALRLLDSLPRHTDRAKGWLYVPDNRHRQPTPPHLRRQATTHTAIHLPPEKTYRIFFIAEIEQFAKIRFLTGNDLGTSEALYFALFCIKSKEH